MKKCKRNAIGIDPRRLRRWIERNIGERCKEYCWGCFVCRSWRLYDDMTGFLGEIIILDECEALPPPKSDH
jgi:hypothetical protein